MAEPRKVFRIGQTFAQRRDAGIEDAQAPLRHAELMQQVGALRALLAASNARQSGNAEAPLEAETTRLTSELNLIQGAISGNGKERAGQSPSPAQPAAMRRAA